MELPTAELPQYAVRWMDALRRGELIPYLGSGMRCLFPASEVPGTPEALVARLTMRNSVPPKIKSDLGRSAQFIENFKHRKTLVAGMEAAFTGADAYSPLHLCLVGCQPPLMVDTWYDDATAAALRRHYAGQANWGQIQGLSQSEHFGQWTQMYDADGVVVPIELQAEVSAQWQSCLYKPWGGHAPAANYLVSDSDFVEVLTEIDIQTPIPERVKCLRRDRGFLFLGCRFNDQLARAWARQIMKRSAGPHFALLSGSMTRMERRFVEEQRISVIIGDLSELATLMVEREAAGSRVADALV